MPQISPKAIVANPAGLGEDVRVGPFSFIGPEVVVAPGTVIANHVTVIGRTRIGASCRLLPGCIVGCPPDAGSVAESPGGCVLGDGNVIREHVVIEAGAAPAGRGTFLGPNNLIMVASHVGHDAHLEGEGIFANFTRIEHHARIEPFVRTSAFTSVHPYATVGRYSFTTGYVGADRDVPPYAMVQGYPFRVRAVNVENLRRCRFEPGTIEALKKAFRMLFDDEADFPAPERLAAVAEAFDDEHVRHLVDSIRRSAASPGGRQEQPGAPTP